MDRKSKLAQPEHHNYRLKRDKFHGLSRIPVVDKNSIKPKLLRVIKCKK